MNRTHAKALEQAKRMGYVVVEYSHEYTTVEHSVTKAMVNIPVTRTGLRPREQMHPLKWSEMHKALVLGATG